MIAKGFFIGVPDGAPVLGPRRAQLQASRQRRLGQITQVDAQHGVKVADGPIAIGCKERNLARPIFGAKGAEVTLAASWMTGGHLSQTLLAAT